MAGVSIKNFTRRRAPRVAYGAAAAAVLPSWDLSLAFVAPAKARALNETLRRKSYTPNVLSYIAGPTSGEIIICLAEAERQAPAYGMSTPTFVLYLFIHALLHLKGRVHGATMERSERTLLARFAKGALAHPHLHVPTNRNRHRHRHTPGQTGGGRRARG